MDFTSENLEIQLPYYLTSEQKKGLVKELSNFRKKIGTNYFISKYQEQMLQGDGWIGLQIINFDNGDRKQIKGIILSNTCDISPENKRDLPIKIVFSPLIKLENYAECLRMAGLSADQIKRKLQTIKEQNVTSLFYMPQGGGLDEEYVAVLDDLHSVPSHSISIPGSQTKFFTLSMFGFYLFLLKLSIHFCRFHEDLPR